MEFDKSRVYTAVNADELKVGSKCIFACCVFSLKDKLRTDYPSEILINIGTDTCMERFESDFGEWFPLAYLVEPPKEKHYQPFSTIEKTIDAIIQHGGWVKDKKNNVQLLVVGFDNDNVFFRKRLFL